MRFLFGRNAVAKDSIRNYLSKWLKDRNASPESANAQATEIELAKVRSETQKLAETAARIESASDRLRVSPIDVASTSIEDSLRAIHDRLDRIESKLDSNEECLKQLTHSAGGVIDRIAAIETHVDEIKHENEATAATVSRLGSVVFGAAQAMERTRDAFADLEERRKAEREKLSMMVGFGLLVIVLIGIAAVILAWNR